MDFMARVQRDERWATGRPAYPQQERRPILKSWADRGFTSGILERWEIEWDNEAGAMRMPVYEGTVQTGNIWRAPLGVEPRYRYDVGFPKGKTLYGLWKLAPACHEMALVEGPLDAIWAQEAGVSACAILGSQLSQDQVSILSHRMVKQVTLCFDNDEAGRQATHQATEALRRAGCWVLRVNLPQKYKDIQEVKLDEVAMYFSRAEVCVNGVGVVHSRFQRWAGNGRRPSTKGLWK